VWLQVGAYPSLSPLVLVLKVYLRSCGLNEVANGGISSFALTNMVLAHIMDELRVSLGVNMGVQLRSSVSAML
jgi:DNA polymerase sigma